MLPRRIGSAARLPASVPDTTAGVAAVSVGLVVTPTTPLVDTAVIRNEFYGVSADGGYQASGQPVVTIVNGTQTFAPIVLRP